MEDKTKTIIVVDDDDSVQRSFTMLLRTNGYAVETAQNGREAIEKIEKQPFDVALVDYRLPDMDGTDLFPLIQHLSPKTVKLLITGFTAADVAKSAEFAADAYIEKPVKAQDLLSIIGKALGQVRET